MARQPEPEPDSSADRLMCAGDVMGPLVQARPEARPHDEPLGVVVERMLRRGTEYALVWRDELAVGMLGRHQLLELLANYADSVFEVPVNAEVRGQAKQF